MDNNMLSGTLVTTVYLLAYSIWFLAIGWLQSSFAVFLLGGAAVLFAIAYDIWRDS